jgi:hypothetical protein
MQQYVKSRAAPQPMTTNEFARFLPLSQTVCEGSARSKGILLRESAFYKEQLWAAIYCPLDLSATYALSVDPEFRRSMADEGMKQFAPRKRPTERNLQKSPFGPARASLQAPGLHTIAVDSSDGRHDQSNFTLGAGYNEICSLMDDGLECHPARLMAMCRGDRR